MNPLDARRLAAIASLSLAVLMPSLAGAVTLTVATTPSTGVAGISNVTLTGSAFPAGAILPSAVNVHLAVSCGGASVANATASSVTTVIGSTRRVQFQVPPTLIPATYYVSLDGTTTGPVGFNSSGGPCSKITVTRSISTPIPLPASQLPPLGANIQVTAESCNVAKFGGGTVAPALIGEPTAGATLTAVRWVAAAGATPAYCDVSGSINPVDPAGYPIKFRVALPASWNHRSLHGGGGGVNGSIPNVAATNGRLLVAPLALGYSVHASDSGHANADGNNWGLNDESVKNLSWMQMKKTNDVAMLLVRAMYGELPRFRYWYGTSQGGREGLEVMARYSADYDGIVTESPLVQFSTINLFGVLNRMQQIPLASYVPPAKGTAISREIMRQCDGLDGLFDGVISNYGACRDIFDVTRGTAGRAPWAAKRCPDNVDPNPADASANACLTDGQIATIQFFLKPYPFATPLAHGVTSFGAFLPGPGTASQLDAQRWAGQEGGSNTPWNGGLGAPLILGTLFGNLAVNPLTVYVEGGSYNDRRMQMSEWHDTTQSDLWPFYARGGKWIMRINTDDNLASPSSQLNFYESVLNTMERPRVDSFARFYVNAQGGHSANGNNSAVDGNGNTIPTSPLPLVIDPLALITQWVENNVAPAKQIVGTGPTRTRPICSYPEYAKYVSGDVNLAASFTCTAQ